MSDAVNALGARSPLQTATRVGQGAATQNPAELKELQDAAADFEAMFLKQMMAAMRKAVPQPEEGAMFSHSHGEEMFRDMLDDEYARLGSRRPSGLGLKEALLEQLLRRSSRPGAMASQSLDQAQQTLDQERAAALAGAGAVLPGRPSGR
ncbi:MAG: rod-binding protein [Magnetococcus sp. WYHC-3]